MAEPLNELTFQSLRRDIMLLTLKPGAVLSTVRVAEGYGVSRTPAREAILKLHQIGLVDVFPKSKTVVSRINVPRLFQEWFIRKSLEVAVIDDFLHNCSQRDLAELGQLIDQQAHYAQAGQFVTYFDYDNAFHQKIFTVAGQQLAWESIVDVNCHYNRLRAVVMRYRQSQEEAVAEHRVILCAMEQRQGDRIRQLMTEHTGKIRSQLPQIIEAFPDYFSDGAGSAPAAG